MFSHQFWEPLLMGIASKSKVFFTTLLVENWTQILSLVRAFFSGFDRVPHISNRILPLCSHVKWSESFTNNIYYPIHVFITNVVGCKIEMQMQYSLFFPLVLTFSDKISTFAIDCKLLRKINWKKRISHDDKSKWLAITKTNQFHIIKLSELKKYNFDRVHTPVLNKDHMIFRE